MEGLDGRKARESSHVRCGVLFEGGRLQSATGEDDPIKAGNGTAAGGGRRTVGVSSHQPSKQSY